MSDLRQMREWGDWMTKMNWQVVKIKDVTNKNAQGFLKKFSPLPIAFLKVQRFERNLDLNSLKKIKKLHKVWYTVLEPSRADQVLDIEKAGYKEKQSTYLPAKTRQIDLTKSETEIWRETSENMRRWVKKVKPKIKKVGIDEFYEGWKKWSPVFTLSKEHLYALKEAMGEKMECHAAVIKNKTVCAIAMIYSKDGAHYYQTWTSDEGRKNGTHYALTWATILDAKKRGKKTYDFEGIYDDRHPLKNWGGFTEFKRKFGGSEVLYPGCFGKWF